MKSSIVNPLIKLSLGETVDPPETSGVGEDSPGDVIPTSVTGYPKSRLLGSENAVV